MIDLGGGSVDDFDWLKFVLFKLSGDGFDDFLNGFDWS